MEKKHISHIQQRKFTNIDLSSTGPEKPNCYLLSNENGMQLSVVNYGATITSLSVPLANGEKVDVVLGFDTIQNYIDSFALPSAPYFGAVVGRYAGRIGNAQFILNDEQVLLTKNHNDHQLHGGVEGFSKAFWNVLEVNSGQNPFICLQYTSQKNEEGFPGEVIAQVTYTLTETNELQVAFTAKSSDDTIINLTQHSYFNLDGHSSHITDQKISVNASQILETNSENIPTGKFINLNSHPFDFNVAKPCPKNIDNTFVLEKTNAVKARLFSKKNNLEMLVFTDQPSIHIYVGGNCFNRIKGKENADYHSFSGICFEAQNFPDAPNNKHFPSAVLKKGETYTNQTTFKFKNLLL